MPGTHALFAPSGAKRWMACPASVEMTADIDSPETIYAAHGTAAHDLIEMCLLQATWPEQYRGQKFGGFDVDDEMIEATTVFVTHVRQLVADEAGCYWQPEQQVASDIIADHGGTIDFHLRTPDLVHVVDYKHGQGVVVEVEANPQLLCYALLVWRGEPTVRLTIVQPRADHAAGPVRTWEVNASYMEWFRDSLLAAVGRAKEASATLKAASDLSEHLDLFQPNDDCRWCSIQPKCPALYDLAMNEAQDMIVPDAETQDVTALPDDRVTKVLENADAIRKFVKAVEDWATNELHAGRQIEGFKLVESLGHTKWTSDDESIIKKLSRKGVKKRDCTVTKVLSPAKVKKLEGVDADFVQKNTERPVTGVKLAREDDKRPAYQPSASPEQDYSAIEEGS